MTTKRIKPNHHESGGPLPSIKDAISSPDDILHAFRILNMLRARNLQKVSVAIPASDLYSIIEELVEILRVHVSEDHRHSAKNNDEILFLLHRDDLGNQKSIKIKDKNLVVGADHEEIDGLYKIQQSLISLRRNRKPSRVPIVPPKGEFIISSRPNFERYKKGKLQKKKYKGYVWK